MASRCSRYAYRKSYYDESIGTKMNVWTFAKRSFKVMSTIESRSPLNVSESVTDRSLVPKDHQQEMDYGESNGHMTDDVTRY